MRMRQRHSHGPGSNLVELTKEENTHQRPGKSPGLFFVSWLSIRNVPYAWFMEKERDCRRWLHSIKGDMFTLVVPEQKIGF